MKILVVDDDPDIRMLLRSVLEIKGWTVDEALDGAEALARPPGDYQVILIDHRMPGLTGDEVAIRLRAGGFDRPIVFFSAYVTKELEARLRRDIGKDLHIVAKTEFAKLMQILADIQESGGR